MRCARFIVAEGENIKPLDVVCIDPTSGKIRKASEQDKNWFTVPEDAYQDGGELCIPNVNDRRAMAH
jgi:hypothetical protein